VGLINWIFDIYQQSRIEQLHSEAMRARTDAMALRSTGGDVDGARLERAIGELALAVKTLQRLVVEKGFASRGELERLMHQIDVEDGRADGVSPIR